MDGFRQPLQMGKRDSKDRKERDYFRLIVGLVSAKEEDRAMSTSPGHKSSMDSQR